jgi:hypothetical protein
MQPAESKHRADSQDSEITCSAVRELAGIRTTVRHSDETRTSISVRTSPMLHTTPDARAHEVDI